MNTLFDTSVWIGHFRKSDRRLVEALEMDQVVMHPAIVGELALGRVPASVQRDILTLPRLGESNWSEVVDMIQTHNLVGRGLGWVDALLLHAAITSEVELVSHDKALAAAFKAVSS